MSVTKKYFGSLFDGRKAYIYTIKNEQGFSVKVTDFGVNIISILVKNKEGIFKDVALGYDTLEEYFDNSMMLGATVGPNVNRISNARFEIDGIEYKVAKNRGNHNIHSDKEKGFHKVLWDSEIIDENAVKFSYTSPDGENGFPGNLNITIIYTVTKSNGLIISYYGVSDKKTVINVTNHNYFNLGGHDSGIIDNTQVRIIAQEYTPIDEDIIPTGEIKKVENTDMDFRQIRKIGNKSYDHNFVISNQNSGIRKIAEAYNQTEAIYMEVYSDLPGMQFYTGNTMKTQKAKDGVLYSERCGFCMEPQYYPNSVNIDGFEKPIFEKGEEYKTTTIYEFFSGGK